MSESNQKTLKILAQKLDAASAKILMTCSIVILASVLMHDGDHLRQAWNWGYNIPLSLLVRLYLARRFYLSDKDGACQCFAGGSIYRCVHNSRVPHHPPLRCVLRAVGRVELFLF